MKGKSILIGILLAFAGAFLALFTYTRFIEKPMNDNVRGVTEKSDTKSTALFTALPAQQNPVDFTYAAELTVHAVVHVKTKTTVAGGSRNPIYDFLYGDTQRAPREVRGYGSGVIISKDGYIITNNHVIEDADEVDVTLNDKRDFTAEIIGRDPSTDLALLKIKGDENDFPLIKYGNSDDLRLGEWVLAVGNPLNLTSTVTAGIVSAKGRSLGLLEDQYRIESFIQTDAALNMGNSGGALVNTNGELVGITAAIISQTGQYAGNSFAIPVTIVKKVIADLMEFGAVQRALIGVRVGDVTAEIAKEQKLPSISGVIITEVTQDGAAAESGIVANDVIVKINDQTISSSGNLQEEVGRYRPGDKVSVTVVRGGKERVFQVTLRNLKGGTGIMEADYNNNVVFGATLEPLSQQEKRGYRLESGIRVTEIGEGRLSDVGVKKGYIITSLNDRKVNSADDARSASSNETTLTSIEGYQSNGTFFSFKFRN